jgi:hypothetical protein
MEDHSFEKHTAWLAFWEALVSEDPAFGVCKTSQELHGYM